MRAIITPSLYTFYPLFEVQKHFFKGFFLENSGLMYGEYSRAGYNGAPTIHTCKSFQSHHNLVFFIDFLNQLPSFNGLLIFYLVINFKNIFEKLELFCGNI